MKNSRKKAIVLILIIFLILSTVYFLVFWVVYFKLPHIIISSLRVGLRNSIIVGDRFLIEKEFVSLIHSEQLSQISLFILNKNNEEVEISSYGDGVFRKTNIIHLTDNFIFSGSFYTSQKMEIEYNNKVIANIYFAKELNLMIILSVYFSLIIFIISLFYVVNRQIKNLYNKISLPIYTLEKTLTINKVPLNIKELQFYEFYNLFNQILHYQNEVSIAQKNKVKIAELTAVTTTIQMLAHDLRQPFSKVKIMLSILSNAKSLEEIKALLPNLTDSTNKDLARIEFFLNDIMTLGREIQIHKKNICLRRLLLSCLKTCFDTSKKIAVQIETNFTHTYKLNADYEKMERVLINIISNALESMKEGAGKIWVTTKEVAHGQALTYLALTIGNSNSFISQTETEKIFDLFFTKGKAKGTGLGLAIVKKIITEHQGNISCVSSAEKGVEFIIQLPISTKELDNEKLKIPTSNVFFREIDIIDYNIRCDNDYNIILKELAAIFDKNSTLTVNVIVLDDDLSYLNYLQSFEGKLRAFLNNINIAYTTNIEVIKAEIKRNKLNLYIIDIDLNDDNYNGLDIIELIADKTKLKTCIHTNRFLESDINRIKEKSKADFILLKPMNFYGYLKVLRATIESLLAK